MHNRHPRLATKLPLGNFEHRRPFSSERKNFESAKRAALFDGESASASGALNFEGERERERRSLFWARARARAALPKGRERAIVW